MRCEIPVRGCVPNFGEVTDYMTGFFLLHLNLVHAVLDMLSAGHNTNGEFYYKIQIIFFLIHEVMIQ